ncbi:hypothetical protein ACM36E_004360, partial [Cronobacter sakazakii]
QGVAGSSPVRSATIQKARISNDSGFRHFSDIKVDVLLGYISSGMKYDETFSLSAGYVFG